LVFLSILFSNSYMIFFWEFYFLPFSVHVQTRRILCNLTVSVAVVFFINCIFLYWLISSSFPFHCHVLGLQVLYTVSFKSVHLVSISFSIQVSDAYVYYCVL
jgi:hypothetical protein